MVPIWHQMLTVWAVVVSMAAAFPMFGNNEDYYQQIKRMVDSQNIIPQAGLSYRDMPPDIRAMYDQEGNYGDYDVLPGMRSTQKIPMTNIYQEDSEWPAEYVTLSDIGQVGGLDTCPMNNVHVFHRAGRKWEVDSFDENNHYTKQKEGPIPRGTIAVRSVEDGRLLKKQMGANQFYMPHGLTLDADENYWVTDVAMHQVFKYSPEEDKPLLTLGKAFEPATSNNDTERFCQPADVKVSSTGLVYIADGYCNSRVAVFTEEGKFVTSFGDGEFDVPHSLALAEDLDVIAVADRENEVVRLFNAGISDPDALGEPLEQEISFPQLGRVFGIDYSPVDGKLVIVTQAAYGAEHSAAYTVDLHDLQNVEEWTPNDQEYVYGEPHAVAVSNDGEVAYVGMIDMKTEHQVWKFDRE